MRARTTEREVTAIHEAGHAVAALALGHIFEFIEIADTAVTRSSGRPTTRHGAVRVGDRTTSARHEAMILLAGICAEKIHRPSKKWTALLLGHGLDDCEQTFKVLEHAEVLRDRAVQALNSEALNSEERARCEMARHPRITIPERVELDYKAFRDDTIELLRLHWSSVLAIAQALQMKDQLSYGEAKQIHDAAKFVHPLPTAEI